MIFILLMNFLLFKFFQSPKKRPQISKMKKFDLDAAILLNEDGVETLDETIDEMTDMPPQNFVIFDSDSASFVFQSNESIAAGSQNISLNSDSGQVYVVRMSQSEVSISGKVKTAYDVFFMPTQEDTVVKITGDDFGNAEFNIIANEYALFVDVSTQHLPLNVYSHQTSSSIVSFQASSEPLNSITIKSLNINGSSMEVNVSDSIDSLIIETVLLDSSGSLNFDGEGLKVNSLIVEPDSTSTITNIEIEQSLEVRTSSLLTFNGFSSITKDTNIKINTTKKVEKSHYPISFQNDVFITPNSISFVFDGAQFMNQSTLACSSASFSSCSSWANTYNEDYLNMYRAECEDNCLVVTASIGSSESEPFLSVPVIIGIVVACVVVFAIIIILITCACCRNKKKKVGNENSEGTKSKTYRSTSKSYQKAKTIVESSSSSD